MKNNKDTEEKPVTMDSFVEDGGIAEANELMLVEEESSGPIMAYTNAPHFNAEDITPPIVKLLQGLSPEVQEGTARPGQWSLAGFGAEDVLTMVPLSYARRREFRDPDTYFIQCSSFDGETGEGDPGGLCSECPHSKWTGDGKNRRGPACTFMYSYMVYIKENDTPAVINFKRTGITVGKSLNSIMARRGFGNVVIKASSKIQKSGKGTYYVPQIQPFIGEEADDVLDEARAFFSN